MTVVCKLAMIEITLEDDKVRLGKILEEIRCLRVEVPLTAFSMSIIIPQAKEKN